MSLSTAFGLVTAIVVLLSLASRSHVFQKIALLLLGAWATTNIAVELLGFVKAPLIVPSLDAVFAILVAAVGYANRSRIALFVFLLYALVGCEHVVAFVLRVQSTYWYYATLDVLFLAQLLIVGAASGWMALRHRTDRSYQRLRPHLARR